MLLKKLFGAPFGRFREGKFAYRADCTVFMVLVSNFWQNFTIWAKASRFVHPWIWAFE